MLIAVQIKNFLSYYKDVDEKPIIFSLVPGQVREKKTHVFQEGTYKTLKFSAIYGANAAGKSNLIKAVRFIRHTLLKGLSNDCLEDYCKAIPNANSEPSYFALDILLGNIYYRYEFTINLYRRRILFEQLSKIHINGEKAVIFNRHVETGEFSFSPSIKKSLLRQRLQTYAEDIAVDDSVLLLRVLNRNKKLLYKRYPEISFFQDIYSWIQGKLDVGLPDEPLTDYSYLIGPDKISVAKNAIQIIRQFATGITNCKFIDVPIEKIMEETPSFIRHVVERRLREIIFDNRRGAENGTKSIVMRNRNNLFIIRIDKYGDIKCSSIEFVHGDKPILFRLSEESDGTIRLLDLLEILLDTNDRTFLIDEFDRSLHPLITKRFIQMFIKNMEHKNTQLIVTTHDVELMNLNLLRRDEIWLVQKSKNGTTNLCSLEHYQPRFDKDIKKAYLRGEYGGIPVLYEENNEVRENVIRYDKHKPEYEYYNRRGPIQFHAYGMDVPEGFMVLKGAKIRENVVQYIRPEDKALRDFYMKNGTIKDGILTRNIVFPSKSRAAAFVGGTRVGGLREWRKIED